MWRRLRNQINTPFVAPVLLILALALQFLMLCMQLTRVIRVVAALY